MKLPYTEALNIYNRYQALKGSIGEKPAQTALANEYGLKSADVSKAIKRFQKSGKRLPKAFRAFTGKVTAKDIKELDRVFSIWIRKRDRNCITCGSIKQLQCGHFVSRRFFATRWDEKNCAAQCVSCNVFNQGVQHKFGQEIDKKYGAGTADKLWIQSRNRFDGSVIPLLIQKYRA